jgi:hypothetical protein
MELPEQLPTRTEIRHLEEASITRPLLNTSAWRLFAGSTARAGCKAKP